MKAPLGLLFVFFLQICLAFSDLVPTHVYLSLTGNLDSLQVTFTTSSLPAMPIVEYWISSEGPKGAILITGDANNTYTFQNPDSPAIDYITSFTMLNLTRGAIFYTYQVCGDAKNESTCREQFQFKSMPEDDSVLNIGFFGDLGSNGTAILAGEKGGLIPYAAAYSADFIFHNGDLAYDLSTGNGANGNDFLTRIEPITSIIPYVVSPGNHEFKNTADPVYYSNWFWGQTTIGHSSNSTNPTMWYSFDVGPNLHIIAVSTEVYCEDTGNLGIQYEWFEKDLLAVRERPVQPWVVVFGHRQMYIGPINSHSAKLMRLGIQCTDSSLQHCDVTTPCDSGSFCAYSLEQLLEKYHVDIFISGHVHTYTRMYPIASNYTYEPHNDTVYLNPQHPTYLISGAPGIQSLEGSGLQGFPNYTVVKDIPGYSFSHMQIYNLTHMYIKQLSVETGAIVDYFWIVKDPNSAPWATLERFMLFPSFEAACD